MSSNADIARLLISKGAKATPDSFVVAALRSDIDRMEVLRSSGIDINTPDSSGMPAVVAAARSGQVNALAWLISRGALVNQTDIDGISALTWAKASGNLLAVQAIAAAGGVESEITLAPEEAEFDERQLESLPKYAQKSGTVSYRPEGLIHKTLSGDIVRSKSEVIVADALHYRGIEFGYEIPFLGKDGRTFKIPDFTIKLPSGSTVVWEHLGMLDQKSYQHAWNKKMLWYILNGLDHADLYVSKESQAAGIDSHEVAVVADTILKRYRG